MLLREARLRPGWRELYPALREGQWESAAILADRLLADALLRGSGPVILGRVLPDAHFDFRGGTDRGGERSGMRLAWRGADGQPERGLGAAVPIGRPDASSGVCGGQRS